MSYDDDAEDSLPPVPEGGLIQVLPIINRRGLHARASAKFVQTVECFDAAVTVTRSGETVGGRSIMGLLPPRATVRHGSIRFEGREIGNLGRKEMRHIWGREMAMIFQDPMTSLNPVMKIGRQIAEYIT